MPGITPSDATTAAVIASSFDEPNTWRLIWLPMSCSLPTRDTTIAADTEISSAGTCATSASPTASSTYDFGGLRGAQAVLRDADDEAADEVDGEDQQTGHCVAAHVLAGAVHGAEELRLFADFGAAPLGFLLVDQSGIQVGVDRHLLARHRVEREARADLGNALGAFRDDDEVDDDEDREHDQSDREVAADEEVAERLDHRAGRARAGVAVHQHDARRCDVQRQSQQGRDQQHRRKRREVERLDHLRGDQHHHQRDRDVDREQHIERERRQRQHHHRQHEQDHERRRDLAQQHRAVVLAEQRAESRKRIHARRLFRRRRRLERDKRREIGADRSREPASGVVLLRIELRRHRHRRLHRQRRTRSHCGAQLIDPGQHLRHGGEQLRRNFAVDFGVRVQRARERRRAAAPAPWPRRRRRGCAAPSGRRPSRARAARPSSRRHTGAPPRSASGSSPPGRRAAPQRACGGWPSRACARAPWP